MRAAAAVVATATRRAAPKSAAVRALAVRAVAVHASAQAGARFQSFHAQSSPVLSNSSVRGFATDAQQSEDANQSQSFTNPEFVILENALNHVGEHGWTIEALAAGATDMGYPSVAHGMFPRGAIELVDYFMDKCHDELREKLIANTELLQTMSVTDRLKYGVRARLELIAPVMQTWPQAMALGALPQNAPTTFNKLAKLSDEIWYFAGDKSTDVSWYTKRALLTGIYASTELFMLSDTSPNFDETWAFLDRRIEESIALGEAPQNLSDVSSMVGIAFQSFFSAATSLAGPLSSQIISNSPLAGVPNPISALGSVVPPSVVSGLASAGFPPNPLASGASSAVSGMPASPFDGEFDPKDMKEIDEELEKLGGARRY